jgi:Cellulase (glycosyl hydrolase family 5)
MRLGRSKTSAISLSIVLLVLFPPRLSLVARGVEAAGVPGLQVSGNRLVDSTGKQVILRGANRSGTEYACIQGWGIFDGPNVTNDDASIPPMKAWGMNGVNVGLNEDCWLGINGVPSAYGGINYQNAIVHYVQTIEANGMYPVLSLFWEAPGTKQATNQIAMPDADHATAFWQSVATTFKSDPAVVFRLKEEPYPAGNSDTSAAWKCWRDGGSACSEGYTTVGMQSLVNTIRATGATNVLQVPGIQYANTMTQFLTYKPTDSLNNLMAVVDIYPDMNPCGNTTCYNTYYAPIINQMPFMAGEFGESVNGNICGTTNSNILMNWFDAHNSGYFAWTWDTWGTTCGDLSLILSYDGTPKSPNGTNYRSHLLALVGAATPTPTSVPTVNSTAAPTATKTAPTATPTMTPTVSGASAPTATPTCVVRGKHCK